MRVPISLPRKTRFGWGGRIRTYGTRYQKALPYRLATPQLRGCLRCSGAVIKAKKRRRIALFVIWGGLAPSPVFLKDGFKKVTLLILLGFMRCLPTYVLLTLRPVGCLDESFSLLGIESLTRREMSVFVPLCALFQVQGQKSCRHSPLTRKLGI